ncbi:NAD(P)-dependent alcohol dehydrogenase [Loktanella sp. F6476L]|uniref:NAD(P)-dependent alcohol dehydrogenase n=1 Tax=Loktanella sp. F6476L TaxID=2926405 RepID=UPI001FF3C0BA|nr:NAD(P)-dependent alcohol dehydrogenase [Loktanella sp. F6476L]MCK0118998.1 NAD(P)-dependent alcohol dehydrogenase [Loktanella sp. F6476L]
MFASSYTQYGSPDVLELIELPTPAPKSNDILVQIVATTVSAGDWRARSLTMPKGLGLVGRLVFGITGPRKQILGTEFSGVVVAKGADVTNFEIGDAVVGFPGASFGAHAEFITVPANGKVVRKPDNLSFEDAAAIPFGATTAYDFLVNKTKLQKGQTVLINGASGAVGSACVQIAKHIGAHVTAVCSGRNVALVKEIGADKVINYREQSVISPTDTYDVVVDTVGTLSWAQAQHCIKVGGKMVLIAGKTSDMIFGGIKAKLAGKTMIGGVASEAPDILAAVVQLAAQANYRPVIDRVFAFDDMQAAHAHVDTGRKRGNVLITVAQPSNIEIVA